MAAILSRPQYVNPPSYVHICVLCLQGAATPVVGDVSEAAKVEVNGLTSPSPAEEEAAAEPPATATPASSSHPAESTKPSGATSAPPSKDSRDSAPRELTPKPTPSASVVAEAAVEEPTPAPAPAPATPAAEDTSKQAAPRDNTPHTPQERTHTDRQTSKDRDTSVKDKDVRNQSMRESKEQELNKSVDKQPSADREIKDTKESKDVVNSAADVSRTAPAASHERPSTDNKEADNKVSALNEKNDTKRSASSEKTLDNKSDDTETVIKKSEPPRPKLDYKEGGWFCVWNMLLYIIKTHVRGFFDTDLHEVSWHFVTREAVRPSGF